MKIGQSIPGLLADIRGMTIANIRGVVASTPREDDLHMLNEVGNAVELLRRCERKVMQLERNLSRIVDTM